MCVNSTLCSILLLGRNLSIGLGAENEYRSDGDCRSDEAANCEADEAHVNLRLDRKSVV